MAAVEPTSSRVESGRIYSKSNRRLRLPSAVEIDIKEDDYLRNNLQLMVNKVQQNLNSLRDNVNREAWIVPPVFMNAFYNILNNEMIFPAAILRFPALSSKVPAYINYGRLGMIVGHEMTHGFDINGHQHNEVGNIDQWWTNATYEKFLAKANCFVNQFNSIKDLISGMTLRGTLSLGENMADTGGVKIAYTAFMKLLSKNTNMHSLPGMTTYTPEQLFFIAFGNFWCEIYTPEGRRQLLQSEKHSLGRYRINYSLKNLAEFGATFHCPKDSRMTLKDRCEMW